jgi:hypothetical protein
MRACELRRSEEMTKNKELDNLFSRNCCFEELGSLGLNVKSVTEMNDSIELESLIDNIKQTMYQDYKTAYNSNLANEVEEYHFGHLI